MKPSRSIYSCTLIASLSLLNIGSAWSAPEPQEQLKTAAGVEAKASKSKLHKAKAGKVKTDKKITPEKAADADIKKTVPAAASVVTTNPYLANQPIAALPKTVNPYLSNQSMPAAAISTPPVVSAPVISAPVVSVPVVSAPPATAPASTPVATYRPGNMAMVSNNPYLSYPLPSTQYASNSALSTNNTGSPAIANPQKTAGAENSLAQLFTSLKMALPSLSLPGDVTTLLPVIKKVYPTGEKPLVVLNFKCPTEMIGITPPPMKLLHEAVNLGFDGLNKTNLLSFNLQQVCS